MLRGQMRLARGVVTLGLVLSSCYASHRARRLGPGERLSSVWEHVCFIDGEGRLFCWGSNRAGELGTGLASDEVLHAPAQVAPGTRFASVSAGVVNTCAITVGGALLCWGSNTNGILRTGDVTPRSTPVVVGDEEDWIEVALSAGFVCGLHADGRAECWGAPYEGGEPPAAPVGAPRALEGRFLALRSGGWYRTFALRDDGRWLVSENDGRFTPTTWEGVSLAAGILGQLVVTPSGDTAWEEDALSPLATLEGALDIDAAYDACGVVAEGEVRCVQPLLPPPAPYTVPLPDPAVSIAVGSDMQCALTERDEVWCWRSSGYDATLVEAPRRMEL